MTYRLFYAEGSAAMGVRVILEEVDVPYEFIQSTIAMDQPRSPEQLEINPNGWVPVLVWGDLALRPKQDGLNLGASSMQNRLCLRVDEERGSRHLLWRSENVLS